MTSNRSATLGRPELRYAANDGARYHATFRTVAGTLAFADVDADVALLHAALTLPDGAVQPVADTDVASAADLPAGTVSLSLVLVPPAPGDYALALWLSDAGGNESNRLVGELVAE